MDPAEFIFMSLLIAVLLAVAGYFGYHQWQVLRGRGPQGLGDRRFAVRQAWRRLFCCALMVVFAGMLVGWFSLDARYRELHAQAQAVPEAERGPGLSDEYKDFARFLGAYWSLGFLVVFLLLGLAALDAWSIARHGLRQHRQLQADHRADLEEHLARLRSQRNGDV